MDYDRSKIKQQVFEMKKPVISLEKAFEYVGDNCRYQQNLLRLFYIQFTVYCMVSTQLPILLPRNQYSLSWFYIGSCVSGLVFPLLCERLSPVRVVKCSLLLSTLNLFVLVPLQPSQLPICLFTLGCSFTAFEALSYIYLTNISGNRFQRFALNILNSSWTFSQVVFACLYQLVETGNTLIILGLVLLISLLFSQRFLIESPKYLIQHQRFEQAKQVLRSIQLYNHRPTFNFELYEEHNEYKEAPQHDSLQEYKELFSTREQVVNNSIILYLWFIRYYLYFGIQYTIFIGERRGLNLVLLSVCEVIGMGLVLLLEGRLSGKSLLKASLVIMCLSSNLSLILSLVQSTPFYSIQMAFTLLFKLGLSLFTSTLLGFTHKTFSPRHFSKGIGLSMTAGKLALTVVPLYFYSFDLVSSYPVSYLCLFTFPALIILKFHSNPSNDRTDSQLEMTLL